MTQISNGEIKTISSSGQISLGKAFAGKVVKLEHLEDGRWMVTPVQIIPEHLMWAYTPEVTARLEKHLAKNQPSKESDLDALEAQILEQQ
jgi:hypothetical protein